MTAAPDPICDDCVCEGRGCQFIRPDEQPYYTAFRLRHRAIERPANWDFVSWIGRQWRAWRKAHGLSPEQTISEQQRADFGRWVAGE
jgi:hypothetical protein